MAEQGKGLIMARPTCSWVLDWLPLLVDESEGLDCDGSGLSDQDRRLIEQHLEECRACRMHHHSLQNALSVLSITATEMTAEPRTASLWPNLEDRIRGRCDPHQSGWLSSFRALCPPAASAAAERLAQGWNQLESNLPLQLAWTRDSIGDFFTRLMAPAALRTRSRSRRPLWFWNAQVGLGLGLGLGAAGLVAAVLLASSLHHRQQRGAVRIADDTVAISDTASPPPEQLEVSEDVVTATPSRTVTRASKSLSLSSSAPAPAVMGQAATSRTVATSTTAAAAETSALRYDFDLEHGTPMPPETRASKSAY